MAPGQGGKIINVQSMHVLDNIVDDSIDALPVRLVYPRRIVLTYSLFLFFFQFDSRAVHPPEFEEQGYRVRPTVSPRGK